MEATTTYAVRLAGSVGAIANSWYDLLFTIRPTESNRAHPHAVQKDKSSVVIKS